MSTKAPLVLGREIRDRLEQLHKLYGREHPLLDILDGLIARLGQARQLYGPKRSLPGVVNGIYAQLDELRQLYNCEFIEETLGAPAGRIVVGAARCHEPGSAVGAAQQGRRGRSAPCFGLRPI
jgi:hypothetical protein